MAQVGSIDEKNQKSKISLDCPFNLQYISKNRCWILVN